MKITWQDCVRYKKDAVKIAVLTSYDFPTARLLDECGIAVQLVGDSVGVNVLGYPDITMVTMADMIHHCRAVARGAAHSFVLCDMPFCSCTTREQALENAQLLMQSGADGVKIESESDAIDKIEYVVSHGIPVCAHIGYTPQTPGLSPRVQGKDIKRALELIAGAQACQAAGAFMIVLELVPEQLSKIITQHLTIPTIGIGAGRFCDGQVQVILDILGLSPKTFRHAKQFADCHSAIRDAVTSYIREIQDGYFPQQEHTSAISEEVLSALSLSIGDRTNKQPR
jgi:3-methyl-2-oxobutanoate hydroxymethyltransferase